MLEEDRLALLSAALRHQGDAEALLQPSPDQSWHLAGFAVECVRKACLSIGSYRVALAHAQGKDADALLDVVMALDGRAVRLILTGLAPQGSLLATWKEAHRYDANGKHAVDAAGLVSETAAIHDRILTALWLTTPFDPERL